MLIVSFLFQKLDVGRCLHFSHLFPTSTSRSQCVYAAVRIEHLQQFLGPSLSLLQCCSPLVEHKHLLFASEIWLSCATSSVCCLEMPCQGLHTVFLLSFPVLLNNSPHFFTFLAVGELLGEEANALLSRALISQGEKLSQFSINHDSSKC